MGQKSVLIAIVLIILAVFLAIIFVVSRFTRNTDPSTNPTTPLENRKIIDVNSIIFDPIVFDGQTVEIETDVSDWVTNKSFTVAKPRSGLGSQNPELLIISNNSFKLPENSSEKELGLGEGGKIKARGKVEILDRKELEDRLGVDIDSAEFALDDNDIENWELGPVIFVTFVEKI